MTTPSPEFPNQPDASEAAAPSHVGRASLHLAAQPPSDEPLPAGEPSSTAEDRPSLAEEQTAAVLANFNGKGRAVVEWFLNRPGERGRPRDVRAVVRNSNLTTQNGTFYTTVARMQAHPVLGPYTGHERERNTSEYWLSADWRLSPALPGFMNEYAAKQAKVGRAALTRKHSRSPEDPGELNLISSDMLSPPTRWFGRQPSEEFEYALRDGQAMEAPLSDRGLRIIEFQGERHIFIHDRHIGMQVTTLNMLQILALYPEGLTDSGVQESIAPYVADPIPLRSVRAHLARLEQHLAGTGTLRLLMQRDSAPVYRVEGAFPREDGR